MWHSEFPAGLPCPGRVALLLPIGATGASSIHILLLLLLVPVLLVLLPLGVGRVLRPLRSVAPRSGGGHSRRGDGRGDPPVEL
jgi:hypothetical protein